MTDPKNELGARFEDRTPEKGPEDTGDTNKADDAGGPGHIDNSSNTGHADNSSNKPGPDRNDDATRHRKQVPMYLPDEKADLLNGLYERLDGRSKVAGDGGIEKHADFMEAVVECVVDHEDELAERLGIENE